MNPIFLFLSALIFFTPVAEAASWYTLQSSTQVTLLADEPQMEALEKDASDQTPKKDKKLKIWDKTSFFQPRQASPGDFYYTSVKSLTEINCTANTLKLLHRIYYDSEGNEIKSIQYDANERRKVVVPDTSDELLFNYACTFKKPTKTVGNAKKASPPLQQTDTDQTVPKSGTSKGKTKEKPKSSDIAKSPIKPSPSLQPAKPADTKK